jgi:hypothetical protein
MKRILVPVVLAVASLPLVMSVGRCRANAQSSPTCPSPLPNCTTSGTLFDAKFGCTQVTTNSAGNVKTSILRLSMTNAGTATAQVAENGNDSGTTMTFQDFTTQTGLTTKNYI